MAHENQKCPVTGLPIVEKLQWTDIRISDDFVVTYQMIGDRILFTSPRGRFTRWNLEKAYAALDQVLTEAVAPGVKIVQIDDFKNISGTPTRSGSIAGVHYFEHQAERYLGAIAFNVSLRTKLFLHVAWRLRREAYHFHIQNDYENAVKEAQQIIQLYDSQTRFQPRNFISRPEWKYEGPTLFTECKVLDGMVVYALHRGYLQNHDVEPVSKLITTILDSGCISSAAPYFIADYSGITGASWHGRVNFLKTFKTIKVTYGPPKVFVLIGGNRIINAAMKMAQKKMGLPIFFAKDLDEALDIVQKHENPATPVVTPVSSASEEHGNIAALSSLEHFESEIMEYIGSVTWDAPGNELIEIAETHPFKSVFDAISLLKLDVDELLLESKKAREEAEFANNAKSQFLANISHEIRTPLNGILGMTDLMLKNSLTEEERRDHLLDIKYSGESLMEIIIEILDFSKIEAGKINLDHRVFKFRDISERVMMMLGIKAHAQKLELSSYIDPTIPEMLIGDPLRIRQVLINLIGNALKFTEMGHVQLRILKKSETNRMVTLEFSVSDTGVGIEPEKIPVIFEKFSQVDNSFTRQYSGTGLGLTIVQSLVQLMGGSIKVESEIGKGSRFSFEISLEKPLENPDDVNTVPVVPVAAKKFPPLNILLVEDNLINRKLVERYLKMKAWDVVYAPNGKEAVSKYLENAVDVILMDIQMPEMDGYEATQKIRALEEGTGRHVPIIALTAHALDSYMKKSVTSGMDDYLTKPIDPEEMYRVILRLTSNHHEQKIKDK